MVLWTALDNSQQNIIFWRGIFSFSSTIKYTNNRIWSKEKPTEGLEYPLYDQKVSIFCAISSTKVYGPYFFPNNVNQHNYLEILKDWLWPKLLETYGFWNFFFQQNVVPAHTAKRVQNWLTLKFGKKLVKELWPPWLPDLSPCDFLLWGYLHAKVYSPMQKNLEDLKANIRRGTFNPQRHLNSYFFRNAKKA